MNEYKTRRNQLMQQMGADTAAILFAAQPAYRSGHTEYAYRQNSDFYYLTGFCEPQSVLILLPGTDTPVILFNQSPDPKMEVWTGRRIGQQGALDHYGIDAAYPIETIDEKLPELLNNKKIIYYPIGESHEARILAWLKSAQMPDLSAVQKLIAQMRLIKSPVEVALLQQAASISAKAHNLAMQRVTPGMKEYQLAAEYIYHFTQSGALDVAYLPIVGGGQNACILHYVANTDTLRDGDLVLVDAGCEYQYYCADVSRTFPVNGRFTNEQKALYDVVLNSYLAGLETIKPGNNWTMVREAVNKSLTAGLSGLKIPGELKEFFMHGPGHWLGLDVHDVGPYKVHDQPITFSAGMVLTLEPGIYIDEPAQVDKKWWHTGIRIEDDILVTEQGHQVLTQESPILPKDIEQLMR